MKKIAILGSTGSIGTQTLEVVRENGDIEVLGLAAGSNIKMLEEQIREIPGIRLYGDPDGNRRVGILSFNIGEEDSAYVADWLYEEHGIAVSDCIYFFQASDCACFIICEGIQYHLDCFFMCRHCSFCDLFVTACFLIY